MRKYTMLIHIIWILTLCSKSAAGFDFVFLKDLAHTPFYQSLRLRSGSVVSSMIILPEGSFNEPEVRRMIQTVDRLPASLLNKAAEESIKIRLFTGRLTDLPGLSALSDTVPRGYSDITWDELPGAGGNQTVYVKIGASEKGNGHGSISLELHEFAHSISRIVFGHIHHRPDFQEIWQMEAKRLFPGQEYFLLYPEEYFAECFAYFYTDKKTNNLLREKAPKTYQYIKQIS